VDPNRAPLSTGPTDRDGLRLSGARNFINNGFGANDRGTIIAFHGDGMSGVFPKSAQSPGEAPTPNWFTPNFTTLDQELSDLASEEVGRTPLYDALQVGNDALRSLPPAVRQIMVAFSDGADNSSNPITFDQAKTSLTTEPKIPFFGIGLG